MSGMIHLGGSTQSRSQSSEETIAVVGGGIAGTLVGILSRRLKPKASIYIFDAADRLGGRILSANDQDGRSFPLGAWRYHPTGTPETCRLLAALRIGSLPWQFRLRKVRLRGRTYTVGPHSGYEETHWGSELFGGDSEQERRERFRRYWRNAESNSSLPDGISWRELMVAASGYNCIDVLPAECAEDLFLKAPERNPSGWSLPEGGFIAAVRTLATILSRESRICLSHKLVRLDRMGELQNKFILRLDTGYREIEVQADMVVLAVGGQDLLAVDGNMSEQLWEVGSRIGVVPKFRAWLRFARHEASSLPFETNSILICDQAPRKLYVSDDSVMVYSDLSDAMDLKRLADTGTEQLAELVNGVLASFFEGQALPRGRSEPLHWKYWAQGVQYPICRGARDVLACLPSGLTVVNEAFTDHHGFVEGALVSAREACRTLFPWDWNWSQHLSMICEPVRCA